MKKECSIILCKSNLLIRFQVFCLFMGMLICLPFKYLQTNEKKDENKLPMNPYLMIVPALFDVLATILDSFALAYVSIISLPIIN